MVTSWNSRSGVLRNVRERHFHHVLGQEPYLQLVPQDDFVSMDQP
jgi:hypothetical protein